ncbi:MAG: cell division protein FtsW, partial [Candidatus Atribacteria bacterium]|nr:cell division protein FtsW [Candidatus Atribacteria bacterium]
MILEKKFPDFYLFAIVIILLIIGICMVFSSSFIMADKWYGDSYYFLKKQIIYAIIALIVFLFSINIDYHHYKKISIPLLILSIILLSVVFIPGVGRSAGGAIRWINLGLFSFQPSEIAKFALILYMAESMSRKDIKDLKTFVRGILPSLVVIGTIFILILKEPDFSTALIVLGISFVMLFIGGTRITQLVTLIAAAIPIGILILLKEEYRKVRLLAFLDPWKDPLDSGFHVIQSLLALGSGGITGVGLAQSRQKYFYLPDQHTDFIFSIIGEELGFIGTLSIIILFTLLLWRGYRISIRSTDHFGC